MKLKEGYELRKKEDGSFVAVPSEELASGGACSLRLNYTSAVIWEMFEQGKSVEEIIPEYAEEFSISEEQASKDINKFISLLQAADVIQD